MLGNAAPNPEIARRSEAFCTWVQMQTLPERISTPGTCGHVTASTTYDLEQDYRNFFARWMLVFSKERMDTVEADFEAFYARSIRDRESKRRVAFSERIRDASIEELCREFRATRLQTSIDELGRRSAFSASDRKLIQAKQMQVGMSEAALQCSWGQPEDVNRTVTSTAEHKQYVYGSRYVYVDNGVVTGFQD
jgi:hypothetical protein